MDNSQSVKHIVQLMEMGGYPPAQIAAVKRQLGDQKDKPRPAFLYMKLPADGRRKSKERRLFFEDHNDALTTALAYGEAGWGWKMEFVEVYYAGQMPELPPTQMRMPV